MLRLITTAFAAAFVLAATGLASAADMPKKAGDPRNDYALATTWGGFYIGPSIGYAWGETKVEFGEGDVFKIKPDGFIGGGQAGVNWQYGQVVAGIEGDLMYMNIKSRLSDVRCEGDCGIGSKYDMLASFRARVGLTVINPSTLVYATGGVAWGRSLLEGDGVDGKIGMNHLGWVAGGGVEFILSPHWTARIQALHFDFGQGLVTKDVVNIATIGLNFKFGPSN